MKKQERRRPAQHGVARGAASFALKETASIKGTQGKGNALTEIRFAAAWLVSDLRQMPMGQGMKRAAEASGFVAAHALFL